MLKRKYGDYRDWKRVIQKRFASAIICSKEFIGHVTLIEIVQVTEPLIKKYGETSVCIADNGCKWLQYFPKNKNFSLTVMFDSCGKVTQWYIDICKEIGAEKNVPWIDDLFIDIVVLPSGEVFQLDTDELEEALKQGVIDQQLYELAWYEAHRITKRIQNNEFPLLNLVNEHKFLLEQKLK
ncbi:DUF402 domain-containing protein [Metabacillus indicus]|uniref:DUF402 domain-containing protein n=1 Tax=Metabacillus indicus TaxID=246786 RepID=UPI003CF20779